MTNRSNAPKIFGLMAAATLLASTAPRVLAASDDVLYPARIAFQSDPFPDFTDMSVYKAAIKKALRTKMLKPKANGDWTFHFVAFLNRRKAGRATRVNLAFFRKKKLVDFVEYAIKPSAKVLMAKATLQKSRGFTSGDSLRAKVTIVRRSGKRDVEIVLASTRGTFVLE